MKTYIVYPSRVRTENPGWVRLPFPVLINVMDDESLDTELADKIRLLRKFYPECTFAWVPVRMESVAIVLASAGGGEL